MTFLNKVVSIIVVTVILSLTIFSIKVLSDITTLNSDLEVLQSDTEKLGERLNNKLLEQSPRDTITERYENLMQDMNSSIIELEIINNDFIQIEMQNRINQKDGWTTINDEEFEILCRIVEAEATGWSFEQKRNVAWCVLNRVDSESFPNTIESVVFQENGGRYQFSPLKDGRYYTVPITESSREAVRSSLRNEGSHEALFFMARSQADESNIAWFNTLDILFNDGIHEYFNYQ